MFQLIYQHGGSFALALAILLPFSAVVWVALRFVRSSAVRPSRTDSGPESLFATVAWGYFMGLTAIMLPFFVVAVLLSVGSGGSYSQLFAPLLIPVIAAGQAIIIGGVVALGAKIRAFLMSRLGDQSS